MDIGDVDSFILQPSHAHLKVLHSLEEMDGICNVARRFLMNCTGHEKNHVFTHVHWLYLHTINFDNSSYYHVIRPPGNVTSRTIYTYTMYTWLVIIMYMVYGHMYVL